MKKKEKYSVLETVLTVLIIGVIFAGIFLGSIPAEYGLLAVVPIFRHFMKRKKNGRAFSFGREGE